MTAVAFKSSSPSEIAEYMASREVACAEFNEKVTAFREKVGGRELTGFHGFDGSWAITGFGMKTAAEELPAGWRRDRSSLNAVAAKRTPEGKEIAAELYDLRLAGEQYPGVPWSLSTEIVDGMGHRLWPRVEKIGDDYFMTLSMVPKQSELEKIDGAKWEAVKLSEYHAAIETAAEAA